MCCMLLEPLNVIMFSMITFVKVSSSLFIIDHSFPEYIQFLSNIFGLKNYIISLTSLFLFALLNMVLLYLLYIAKEMLSLLCHAIFC